MIIVSQNKKLAVPLENTEGLHIEEKYESRKEGFSIVHEGLGMTSVLGTFITEERAKEVLQEILIAYGSIEMLKIPNIQIHEFIPSEKLIQCLVYQMPEE